MTQHLSPEELIDLVEDREGRLGAGRASHFKSCESCRQQVQELREVMLEASDLNVPEPSPLFWEHASHRLAEAIATDARFVQGRSSARLGLSHITTALATAAVVLAVVVGLPSLRPPSERLVVGSGDGVAERSMLVRQADGISADEPADWALLLTMADAVEWADGGAELLMVDRRAINGAVFELTLDERQALVQLLKAELEGSL